MPQKTSSKIDFVMFALYRVAELWGCSVPEAYDALQKADIVNGYLIPSYDVLHTQGAQYIAEDLDSLAVERGVRP